jgi:hypothetical protein
MARYRTRSRRACSIDGMDALCVVKLAGERTGAARSPTPVSSAPTPIRPFRKETLMTASKAVAGGIAANLVTLCLWAISTIPGWDQVPQEPKAAIIALVSSGVAAAIVYFAPANRETVAQPAGADPQEAVQPAANPAFAPAN